MEWFSNSPYDYPEGHTRIRRKYLYFPKRIGTVTKWLTRACWREKVSTYITESDFQQYQYSFWEALEWLPLDYDEW